MKRTLRFKPLAAILLVLSVLMVSLHVPLPVRADSKYSPAVSYKDGDYACEIYYTSDYLPFLVKYGNTDYNTNGYRWYAWGVMFEGSAIDLSVSGANFERYGFSISSGTRQHFKSTGKLDFEQSLSSSNTSYYVKFKIAAEDDMTSNVCVFNSVDSAAAYYERGDKSGLLRLPGVLGEVIEQPSSGSSGSFGSEWSDQVISIVNGWLGGVLESLAAPLKSIVQGILDVIKKIELIRAWIFDHLPSFISTPIKAMEDKLHGVGADILTNALEMASTLKNILLKLETFAVNQVDNFLPETLKQAVIDGLSFVDGTLENFYNFHVNGLNKVINYLKSLAAIANSDDPFWVKIATLFTKPARDMFEFLFIPDEDYFDNLHTRISNRFSVITDLEEGGEHILNYFKTASGASPPSFTITLSDHGNFKLGNKTVTIDMSWYAPYKSTGDLLIAGAIWARSLWNIYRRLPEILHGAGMIADSVDKLK